MIGAGKPTGRRGLPSLYGYAYWVSDLPALNRTPGYALARCREIPDGIKLPILTKNYNGRLTPIPPPSGPRRPICSKAAGEFPSCKPPYQTWENFFGQLPYRRLRAP